MHSATPTVTRQLRTWNKTLGDIKYTQNKHKTELIVVAFKVLLQKVWDLLLDVDGSSISPSMEVHNLGFILDSTLSFQSQNPSQNQLFIFSKISLDSSPPSLNLSLRPSSMPSSPPAWITVMESCPGSLPKPWTGSSMCRTLLPGSSPAPSPGNTSPPLSSAFTGSQLNHTSLTKFSSWPINLSIPSPPIYVWPPPALYPVVDTVLIRHTPALHPSHQTANPRWQSLPCDSSHSLEHSPC